MSVSWPSIYQGGLLEHTQDLLPALLPWLSARILWIGESKVEAPDAKHFDAVVGVGGIVEAAERDERRCVKYEVCLHCHCIRNSKLHPTQGGFSSPFISLVMKYLCQSHYTKAKNAIMMQKRRRDRAKEIYIFHQFPSPQLACLESLFLVSFWALSRLFLGPFWSLTSIPSAASSCSLL